jgi:hypothetical protein
LVYVRLAHHSSTRRKQAATGKVLNMTPELETLDQLQGRDLPLEIILHLFPDVCDRFAAPTGAISASF